MSQRGRGGVDVHVVRSVKRLTRVVHRSLIRHNTERVSQYRAGYPQRVPSAQLLSPARCAPGKVYFGTRALLLPPDVSLPMSARFPLVVGDHVGGIFAKESPATRRFRLQGSSGILCFRSNPGTIRPNPGTPSIVRNPSRRRSPAPPI